jgi:hypothetical protein
VGGAAGVMNMLQQVMPQGGPNPLSGMGGGGFHSQLGARPMTQSAPTSNNPIKRTVNTVERGVERGVARSVNQAINRSMGMPMPYYRY